MAKNSMNVVKVDEDMSGNLREHSISNELQFTGNWFIDAGILGFVNLMEEVYGWDLERLQEEIKKRPKAVYYWYFPIGYICHAVKETRAKKGPKKRKEVEEQIEEIISEIPEPPQTTDEKNLFEEAWKWITGKESLIEVEGVNRIKMNWAGRYRLLTNFPLFQPRQNIGRQKNIFMSLLGLKEIEDEILRYIDKATSKFLPSASDFSNISFTKSCITMENLFHLNPTSSIFILTYPLAFISETLDFFGYQIMFYSNDLTFTYNVGKKLKFYLKRAYEEGQKVNILRITWNSIIDSLIESESLWSLENMYLIKIKLGKNQDLDKVEYIGIPKLQASIILDDTIRDALNINLPVKASNGKIEQSVWLLEEFIKQKPLLPHLIKNVHLYLAENLGRFISVWRLVYASIVDAKVRELGQDNRLFGDYFFSSYRQLLSEIKDDARRTFGAVKTIRTISEMFGNSDERKSYANLLLGAIRRNDKYRFVNTILKPLVEKKKAEKKEEEKDFENDVKILMNFIFDKILPNDLSWKNYALILVVALIKGGEEDGGEE